MATFPCPCCGVPIPLSAIPEADLLSERGRRNAAKRKSFGARHRGRAVWKSHSTASWRCRCPDCLVASVDNLEAYLACRVQAHIAVLGVEPEWAEPERQRLRAMRAEIEAAIAERRRVWARAPGGQVAGEVAGARAA